MIRQLSQASLERLAVLPWDDQVDFDWQPPAAHAFNTAQDAGAEAVSRPFCSTGLPSTVGSERLRPGRYLELYQLLTGGSDVASPSTARQATKEELRTVSSTGTRNPLPPELKQEVSMEPALPCRLLHAAPEYSSQVLGIGPASVFSNAYVLLSVITQQQPKA